MLENAQTTFTKGNVSHAARWSVWSVEIRFSLELVENG